MHIVNRFVHALIYAEIFIEIGKVNARRNGEVSILIFIYLHSTLLVSCVKFYSLILTLFLLQTTATGDQAYVLCWITKNVIVFSLCIKACEDFYVTINEAERRCVTHLGTYKHSGVFSFIFALYVIIKSG